MSDQPQSIWNQSSQVTTSEQHEQELLSDRRQRSRSSQDGMERRQFGSNYSELTAAGAELGKAIDSYKVAHRRRYVTYDEILVVLQTLGYERRPVSVDLTTGGHGASLALAEEADSEVQGRLPVNGLSSIDSPTLVAIN